MELMIAEKIKKYRKERELTQEALAAVLGVSPQSISKWECGDGYPDVTLLPSIANYFEITVDELIGNDEISAREDVEKNYFNVKNELTHEERLTLALKYNKKYPRNWHIANSLMSEISRHHRDKIGEYKEMLYALCERLLRECTDSVMRRSAVTSICMICEEDEINEWLNRDTSFWYEKRHEVLEERYKLTGDRAQYEMYRDAGNFLHASRMLGRIAGGRDYCGNPEKAVDWNKAYIGLLDAASGYTDGEEIPGGWLPEYNVAYMRLCAACFGVKEKKAGYEYLEKAIDLAERYAKIPEGSMLGLGNKLFYGDTKAIKNKYTIVLPNGKGLLNLSGIRRNEVDVAGIMQSKKGWEWLDAVRGEERYAKALERAKSIG